MSSTTNTDTETINSSSQPEAQAPQDIVPIDRLPLELLRSIFEFTTFGPPNPIVENPSAPWCLAFVCRFWRAIVTSLPLLWTTLTIGNNTMDPKGFVEMGARSAFPRLMTYIRLSSPLPVNILVSVRKMPGPHIPFTRTHAGVLSHVFKRLAPRIRSMGIAFDSWEFYSLLTEGLTYTRMPILTHWKARYINDPRVVFSQGFLAAKHRDCHFESAFLTADTSLPHELALRGIALYRNLRYLYLTSTPMSWDKFCPSNLIELHLHDLPLRYRPNASRLRQILELNRDTLQVLELSGCISPGSDLTYLVTMSRVHTLKLAFNHIQELFCLFPAIQFPALSSLEVNNLIPQSTWFGRPPKDMQLVVTAVMERLTWALPLHQLKALRLDCIPFSSPSREIPTPVSLNFFKKLTSLTSLSLYSPSVVALKCMNRSPDILPALKDLQISTPGANYYEHILSFWLQWARMPARKMLEHFELTLPVSAKGRAEEFVQRKEVFAIATRGVVLNYQPDMHPPDQDVEMVGDDSDELGDEETDESGDSDGDMDED